jgi:hypothetical protein
MSEYESEPIRGLPGNLPPGEAIIWQGAPEWRRLARGALHVRGVAFYFAALVAWRIGIALNNGEALASTAHGIGLIAALASAGVGLLLLFAWLSARTTVYTLTNKRIVLRFGVALPMCVNLPLARVAEAGIAKFDDGCGDIPLALTSGSGLGYLQLWPYARPWKLAQPQPMLRAIADVDHVAGLIAQALLIAVPTGRRVAATTDLPDYGIAEGATA